MDLSRTSMRPLKLSDVEDVMVLAGDDQVTQNTRWSTFTSRDQALSFIRDVCIPHPWCRSICVDDRLVGVIFVFPGSGHDRCTAEMSYYVAAKHWGKGIGTKAVKIAVSQVFKDFPDLARLQAFTVVENKASQRVLEKAGFLKEGVLRKYRYLRENIKDAVVFSFLSADEIPSA